MVNICAAGNILKKKNYCKPAFYYKIYDVRENVENSKAEIDNIHTQKQKQN